MLKLSKPTIFEGTLAEFSGFLFEFFNSTLVNSTTFVNQVTSGSGLSRINVTDD